MNFGFYFGFVAIFTIIAFLVVYYQADVPVSDYHPMVWGEAESAFRHTLFQVVSVITTTGFVTADFTTWIKFPYDLFLWINVLRWFCWIYSGWS